MGAFGFIEESGLKLELTLYGYDCDDVFILNTKYKHDASNKKQTDIIANNFHPLNKSDIKLELFCFKQ
jgi:hypothetical protein